jgi:serine/threonine protein kinase
MQNTSIEQLVGQVIGEYRCELFLGKRRLHTVYQVRHLATQQLAALVLTPIPASMPSTSQQRFLARFHQEAASIKALHHPNIVPFFDHGDIFGTPYMIIPLTRNISIVDYLRQLGYHDHAAISNLLPQAAAGLHHAHKQGIFHGSLRPSMLVANENGGIQVAGFGLLRMLQADLEHNLQPYAHLLSIAGTLLIAPPYVAPEQVKGQAVDARSDVYSLACIVFELLTGKPPFSGENPLKVAQMHVNSPVPLPRDINPSIPLVVSSVVQQAMEIEPTRRFKHVDEFCEAFVQASQGALTSTQKVRAYNIPLPPTPTNRPSKSDSANRPSQTTKSTSNDDPFDMTGASQKLTVASSKLSSVRKPSTQYTQPAARQKTTLQSQATLPGILELPTPDDELPITPAAMPSVSSRQWQLQPPMVSEKVPAVRKPAQQKAPPMSPTPALPPTTPTANRQHSPQAPAAYETYDTHAAHTDMFDPALFAPDTYASPQTPQAPQPVHGASKNPSPSLILPPPPPQTEYSDMPSAPSQKKESNHKSSPPDMDDQELMRNYAWWSQENVAPPTPPSQKAQPAAPRQPEPAAGTFSADPWTMEAFQQSALSSKRKKRSQGVKRRQVVALLATGGLLVAAGGVTVLDITHKTVPLPTANVTPPKAQNNTPQTKMTKNTQQQQPAQAPQGKPIGTNTQTANTSVPFTNPTDNQPGLLIRLPNGNFVAAERACTHQGVPVNYHADTQKLVCPLHGSVFDPADNFKVLQGPATQPLKAVAIKVNANGSITTV